MIRTKKPITLTRAVTRDLPLFLVCASYGSHLLTETESILGFSLSRNFVLFDRGTAIIHRDAEEWNIHMPLKWAFALKDSTRRNAIKSSVHKTKESINVLETIEVTSTSESLIQIWNAISCGTIGMIFAHWVPIFNELKSATYKKSDVLYFEKARRETEKFFSIAADVSYTFLDMTSKKFNVSGHLLKYATYDELAGLFDTKTIDMSILEARKNQPLLFLEDSLYIGPTQLDACMEEEGCVFEKIAPSDRHELQGTVVSSGVITGSVQIITSREHFDTFLEGNILVAPMTSPEYATLIHMAKAVVTDEGGMLSHAAIICRELGKPCVVGTKHATYVLKDFQDVEVDADVGVVTILR